jgi:hypothetical protein
VEARVDAQAVHDDTRAERVAMRFTRDATSSMCDATTHVRAVAGCMCVDTRTLRRDTLDARVSRHKTQVLAYRDPWHRAMRPVR